MVRMNIKSENLKSISIAGAIIILLCLNSCDRSYGSGISEADLMAVDFTPVNEEVWPISSPEEVGLDPIAVAKLYYNASELETIYSLLVLKDGHLIGEDYWHGSGVTHRTRIQSVAKSITSAMVGIAINQGYLTGVDQNMMDFFPELVDQVSDPRKFDITIEHLLQMRAGYPWEEGSKELFNLLWYEGFRPSNLVEVPLVRDPGTDHDYSNLSSHFLAIIVARATGQDLKTYASENLLTPIDASVGNWDTDWEGYYIGHGGMQMTARDMARFGQLYLNGGVSNGKRVLSADWINDSFQTYSDDAWKYRVGRNFKDIGYGYQWWSARSGAHNYNVAWGHGGQLVFVLDDLDMVIVVKADPFQGQSDGTSWDHEKAHIKLVADFIASLP